MLKDFSLIKNRVIKAAKYLGIKVLLIKKLYLNYPEVVYNIDELLKKI